MSTDGVVSQLTHLNDKQKQDLKVLLKDFTKSFNATLGVYPHKNVHINLVPGAQPKHSQPHVIHCIHLAAFKKEQDHFITNRSTILQGASKWGSPTFVTPKKDNTIWWVSNLCELNKLFYINNTHYQLSAIYCASELVMHSLPN
jgi:hypothetical protein